MWFQVLYVCHLVQSSQHTTEQALKSLFRASLVAQRLRICLPMQGTQVQALVWEDPTCRGAAGPVSHSCWACASGACALQQDRPRWWEARAPRWRVAPACRNWRKPSHRNEDPTQPLIEKKKKKNFKIPVYSWGTWGSERPCNVPNITQLLRGPPVSPQPLTTTSWWLEGWRCDLCEDSRGRILRKSLLGQEEESASLWQRCSPGSGSGDHQWNTEDTFL